VKDFAGAFAFFEECNVVDANDFSPLRIDDLLVEQVADHAQHVFIGVIGGQNFAL
jgi:hypothetical protein